MSNNKSIKTILLLWFGSLAGVGFGFLVQVILARYLGPSGFGVFSTAFSLAAIFIPLAGFGISQYWLKEFGKDGYLAIGQVSPSLKLIVINTTLIISLIALWGLFGPHEDPLKYTILIMSFYVAGPVLLELMAIKLQLEEKYTKVALLQIAPHLFRFCLILAILLLADSYLTIINIAFVYVLVSIFLVVFGIIMMLKFAEGVVDLKGHKSFSNIESSELVQIKHIIHGSWPFALAGVFQFIYFQSDIILLNYMVGSEVAGIYYSAFIVIVLVAFPSVVYQKFFLPKIHRWANHDHDLFYKFFKRGNVVMLVLGLLAMVVVWLLAPYAVPILFGKEYGHSIELLYILSASLPVVFFASSPGAALSTKNHMRTKVKIMAMVAIFNIILNIVLIPSYGSVGAAIATVLSNFTLALFYYFISMKKVF